MDVVEVEVAERTPELIGRLVAVWEASVRATHHFLSESEIARIKAYVPQALGGVPCLIVAEDDEGRPVAFMGIAGDSLEMLFVAPEARGKGVGKRLILHGIRRHAVTQVAVNEQNPQARGFYEHMGFRVYDRVPYDDQGKPYPLLRMRLSGAGQGNETR